MLIKNLSPLTKFWGFILITIASLISNDTRFLAVLALISVICYKLGGLKLRKFFGFLILLHVLVVFIKNPNYGQVLYHYDITWIDNFSLQELLYLANIFFKDVIIVNFLLIFLWTSQARQVAASLNQAGLSYQLSYKISQLFYLLPNYKKDMAKLSKAADALDYELSSFAGIRFLLQVKHTTTAASRHFGKKQKRTWYALQSLTQADKFALLVAGIFVIISISLVLINGGRLWNPFVD
ncbi:energy-coupling factor transporter transmembrane component T family protein [Lactococcus insecticola]|uniref:Cobalt ABC transporter permease n=1 Tax=Pseudolactococcus insecticola TaxID=2709158 RepID=A0A6A0B557_9LACT|nr:energy-coupling factor transporter transmembrane component T [Lactococcus insecticola]GFH39783.1 cobalt ABC transporter permease [Lactococcus insecticola]